jgi:hypothetical protein
MRPIYLTRALAAADDNGIAVAQQLGAAGDLDLDGVLVAGGVAQLGDQRRVYIESTGNLSGINFTVYGTRDDGVEIQETLAGPNNSDVNTIQDFTTVTRVAADAAVGTDVIVGTGDVGSSLPVPLDKNLPSFTVMLAAILRSGSANYTAQYTFDDIWDTPPETWTWWDHSQMTAQAGNSRGSLVDPVTAVRLTTNSGTGTLEFQVVQGGTA